MAFNNKRSWRLRFIDIDKSFTVNETEDEVIGYFAIRAPKGNQRPIYFSKNNSEAIDALVGVPSVNWPDIFEVKAFNAEYPCYVSASPGTSNVYPSYFGGFYLTKNGIQKFYNVATKEELEKGEGHAFLAKVVPGMEDKFNNNFKKTRIRVFGPDLPSYTPAAGELGDGFFEIAPSEDGKYGISFEKNRELDVQLIDYDTMENGLVSPKGTDTTYWGDDDEDGIWTFEPDGKTATLYNFGIKYSPEKLANGANPLRDWIGGRTYNYIMELPEEENRARALAELLLNGITIINGETFQIAFGIQKNFTFGVSIESDVLAYWFQQSPTEEKTIVEITDIGYDKYIFDKLLNYAPYDTEVFNSEKRLVLPMEDIKTGKFGEFTEGEIEDIVDRFTGNQYLGFYDPNTTDNVLMYIGKKMYDEKTDEVYFEATSELNTKYVTFQENIIPGSNNIISHIYHNFYRPDRNALNGVPHIFTEEEEIEEYGEIDGPEKYKEDLVLNRAVPKNPNFNNITIEIKEKVNGVMTSGGQFSGSLDEAGTNIYGNPNYYPDLIRDDDTFVCVRVISKFGDDPSDLDSRGFWTHGRLIDPYDIDKDENISTVKKFTIEGDRYCTMVMQSNLAMKKQGGIWTDAYKQIIIDGLTEATLGEYDDAWIFVECTGREDFKPYLAKISKTQENAATISPKLLQPNSKNIITDTIASQVIVTDRVNEGANALYAGEFEVYDPVTKTKYWRQPIGSVARMLARIMDKRLGGAAPAWINEDGIGGQLTDVNAIRSRYQIDEDAEKTLDKKGINPIVLAGDDGVMIVSQKTTRDPNLLSDWSWLGHALSFLRVRREIRDQVMRPQIMKPINKYYFGIRQEQVDNILAKRLSGKNPIWTAASCDIAGVNNAYTKANRDFVIEVQITVTPFSETVTLRMVHNLQA